jgi:KipI family sensor histidine kinase inhibitor
MQRGRHQAAALRRTCGGLLDVSAFRIVPVGDAAVMALLGDGIDVAVVRRVWALAALARERLGDRVLDIVPAYASVLVRFDPELIGTANVMAVLRGAAEQTRTALGQDEQDAPRRIRMGVCFGDEDGVDLEATARAVGLAPAAYVRALCAAEYRVAFLGFLAGFPYLIGLPPELRAPRLAAPRDRVPQGSVAIADGQCGIYPRSSPGGWRLLGRTAAAIFDPSREPAALFAPGDVVRFEQVQHREDAVAEVSAR